MKHIRKFKSIIDAVAAGSMQSPAIKMIGDSLEVADLGKDIQIDENGNFILPQPPTKLSYLCFTAKSGSGTISFSSADYDMPTDTSVLPKIYYSYDGIDWLQYDYTSQIQLDEEQTIWLYGDNYENGMRFFNEDAGYDDNICVVADGISNLEASGNIQSLISKDMPNNIPCDYCYGGLFYGCSNLTKAPELPATTLTQGCYSYMFKDCSSLDKAPELPATTLADNCYEYMFYGCSSLTQAPELPATTLADYCYQSMFSYCSNLTAAPELPATTLVNGCYYSMFSRCSSLTQAPELPATTLAEDCYVEMFTNCYELSEVTTYATSWNTSYTNGWLYRVPLSGTFYNLGNADIPTEDFSGIPTGWHIETKK